MTEEIKEVTMPAETVKIQNLIYVFRGKQVMIDSDLTTLYQVETKRLNEAVQRNSSRFPERFVHFKAKSVILGLAGCMCA